MIIKLSSHQAKIVDLLTIQREINFSKIASTLRISQPLLMHHITSLEKWGVIQRFKIVLNQSNSEQTYLTLLKLRGSKEQVVQDFKNKGVSFKWMYQTFGQYDYIIAKKFASPADYQDMLLELYHHSSAIELHHTIIETSGAIYNTQFSGEMAREEMEYYDVEFPDDDLKRMILCELKKDPLISQLKLAEKVGVSYPTLRVHLQELYHKKIILGKRIRLNFDVLGLQQYYLFLSISPLMLTRLKSLASALPGVIRFSHCIGEFNVMLEVIASSQLEMEGVINLVKENLVGSLHVLQLLHKTKDINMVEREK